MIRQDLNCFEKIQIIEALEASFEGNGINHFLFIHTEFTPNYIIPCFVVTGNPNFSDSNEGTFFNLEGDIRRQRLKFGIQIRGHLRKRIPSLTVQIGNSGHLLPNLGSLKHFPRGDQTSQLKFFVFEKGIPLQLHSPDRIGLSFFNPKRHGKGLPVFTDRHRGKPNLNIEVASIRIDLFNTFDIVGQLFFPKNTGIRNPGKDRNPFPVGHELQQIFPSDNGPPVKYDDRNSAPLTFPNKERNPIPRFVESLNDRNHTGLLKPILSIRFTDFFSADLDFLLIQKHLTSECDNFR